MSLVWIAPLIMTANNDLPVKDVKELITYAKANPGKPSFGSSGVGAAGGPLLEGSTWILFLAPAGTPREIVTRMSAETAKAVAAADIKGRFETIGIEPVGNTPEEAGRFLDHEIAKWAKVISKAGVKPER